MKVDRRTRADHTRAMLDAAARLFRARGLDTVRVADVTQAAGLTHGAFYGHYDSKAALAAAACRASLHDAAQRWRARAARAAARGEDPIRRLVETYLSAAHRDAPEDGCTLSAIGAEAVRDPALRDALGEGAAALALVLQETLAARHPTAAPEALHQAALGMLAAMVGGIVLARAAAADPAASDAALAGAVAVAMRAADTLSPTPSTET